MSTKRQQYHVLVVGFEISKPGRDSLATKTTSLRHYRYDIGTFSLTSENGSWVVKQGKEFVAAFPVANTMILVEDVNEEKL